MNIAEKLRKLREEKGLSQEQLIDELHKKQGEKIAISSIRNYENVNNPRIPQGQILLALSRYYNVSLEYLLDDSINNRKQNNIDIGKQLKLSDNAISSIACPHAQNNIDELDFFLSSFGFYSLLEKFRIIEELKVLKEYINYDLYIKGGFGDEGFIDEKKIEISNNGNLYIGIPKKKLISIAEKVLNEYISPLEYFYDNYGYRDDSYDYTEITEDEIYKKIKSYEKKIILLKKYFYYLTEKLSIEFDVIFNYISCMYDILNKGKKMSKKNRCYYKSILVTNSEIFYSYLDICRDINSNIKYYNFTLKEDLDYIINYETKNLNYKHIINEIKNKYGKK